MHNILINIETKGKSLREYLNTQLGEFFAIWRHIEFLESQEHNGYRDESAWAHYIIPIYTGYGLYCNPESLEDDKRDQYYKTYKQCVQDFLQLLTPGNQTDQCNTTFILHSDDSESEMVTITITDDLIHIHYITTGQW